MKDCIFCKIVAGEIPSHKVFENDDMIIINDIEPQSKLHYLLIPKKHYTDIGEFASKDSPMLARCFQTLAQLEGQLGLEKGYRLATNKGEYGRQTVAHIHIHIFGGEKLSSTMA